MSEVKASELVAKTHDIISMPEICFNVYNMANNPLCSAVEMAQAISADPGLSANVLKVANSPYYGFPSRVDSITRAIAVIGTQDLRELVLATSIVGAFSDVCQDTVNLNAFWHHSLITGLVARQLGGKAKTPILRKERMFVAGLLHKIGVLVMATSKPDLYKQTQSQQSDIYHLLTQGEQDLFGCDHTEVGESLMKSWNLPDMLSAVTRFHLSPTGCDEFKLETAIIHIASMAVANDLAIDTGGLTAPICEQSWVLTGLTEEQVNEAIGKSILEYSEVASAFLSAASRAG
ncbi:MAG: HDOD domain-containing protein [Gammaproteobacteria bacterium]|nr:HDOD domain-containing protein [Gammaproteobacteria bacterium]